jgi:hypothetical protein
LGNLYIDTRCMHIVTGIMSVTSIWMYRYVNTILRNGNITDFPTAWPKFPISLWSEGIKLVKFTDIPWNMYEPQKIYWRVGSLKGCSSSVRDALSYRWSTVTYVRVKEGIYQCISANLAIIINEILLLWKIINKKRLTESL